MPPPARTLAPRDLAALLRQARSAAALTGAGISTAAGIPDFRGPQGLYVTRGHDADRIFDLDHFRAEPGEFYAFTRDFMDLLGALRPTLAHRALARLEAAGLLAGVVTQNIDSLHTRAGSRNVIEVHGSYATASCTACGRAIADPTPAWWAGAVRQGPRAPVVLCPACGGVVKPDVVFFGEAVRGFERAEALARGADLFLVLGSSLAVHPAALLPRLAPGAVVVVNQGPVELAPGPERFFVERPLDEYLAEVLRALGLQAEA